MKNTKAPFYAGQGQVFIDRDMPQFLGNVAPFRMSAQRIMSVDEAIAVQLEHDAHVGESGHDCAACPVSGVFDMETDKQV